MRTTVSIDQDVLLAVKERARRERRSVGEVLSDLARQALTGGAGERSRSTAGEPDLHGFLPFPPRGAVVSNDVVERLRDEEGV